jgi:NTP pyrophosphatase (non-canonical NTP hydrolase)
LAETLDSIWEEIVRFNDAHFPSWRNEDYRLISNALAGEVGEICDATKHLYGGGTNHALIQSETKEHIAEESFDALVYHILLLGAMGFDRDDFIRIAKKKLAVLYERMNNA